MSREHDVTAVQREQKADILVISGEITRDTFDELFERSQSSEAARRMLMLLDTDGGDLNACYRIGRLLKNLYPGGLTAFVPEICRGASMLLVLASDKLIMSTDGELGPLSGQMGAPGCFRSLHHDQVTLRAIGVHAAAGMERSIRYFDREAMPLTADQIIFHAADVTGHLLRPMYDQINMDRLGHDESVLETATLYADRLATANVVKGTIIRLVRGCPALDFVIDCDEASELFSSVTAPTEAMTRLAASFIERPKPTDRLAKRTANVALYLRSSEQHADDDADLQTWINR